MRNSQLVGARHAVGVLDSAVRRKRLATDITANIAQGRRNRERSDAAVRAHVTGHFRRPVGQDSRRIKLAEIQRRRPLLLITPGVLCLTGNGAAKNAAFFYRQRQVILVAATVYLKSTIGHFYCADGNSAVDSPRRKIAAEQYISVATSNGRRRGVYWPLQIRPTEISRDRCSNTIKYRVKSKLRVRIPDSNTGIGN